MTCAWCGGSGCRACVGRHAHVAQGDNMAELIRRAGSSAKLVPTTALARMGELAKLLAAPTNSDALAELLDLIGEVAP